MTTSKNVAKPNQNNDSLLLQDLLGLCLAKWYWFVLSLAVSIGIATFYILKAVPTYKRSASLLIKDDTQKSNTLISTSNAFNGLGIFNSNANVYNEIYFIESPALMQEVVKRLHLDMNYYSKGRWHKNVLYGNQLPITISIEGLADQAYCDFKVTLGKNNKVAISDFSMYGNEIEDAPAVHTEVGKTVSTPVGKITVTPTAYFYEEIEGEMMVIRSALSSTVESCLSKLSVTLLDKETTIVSLTYTDISIQRAEEVLNTLISVYNEKWVQDKNQIAVSTSEFINDRLGVIERELGNVDTDISSYKSEQQVPDLAAAAGLALQESSNANATITSLNNQIYMAKYIRSNLQTAAANNQLLPTSTGINNPQLAGVIAEYNEKLLQRNSLVANSSVDNPLVQDYDATLAAMRHNIETTIDNQIANLNEQIRGQQMIGGKAAEQMASNPKQAKYLLSVERQQKVKEALYMFLLQKREENELSQAFTAYNTRIVTPPTGSYFPISPIPRNIYLVALFAGLLLPIGVLYLQENMNTKVRGRKDVESLTIPFVGEVPLYGRRAKWYQRLLHRFKKQKDVERREIVVREGNRNIINEAFRVVRTNIELMTGQEDKKVMMLTSMNPGSGKTFLAMNIGTSFAVKNQKVIAVDLDMRRASLSSYVNSPKEGMSDFLGGRITDWHSIVTPVEGNDNISVIPVGKMPPNPSELLYSKNLKTMIEELKAEYDLVILDCPPVEIVADASIISKYVDMTLFVIRAELMERDMLPVVEEYYTEKKFNNMAFILNATSSASGRYGYSRYGYHYGYHYGYGYGYGRRNYGYAEKD